MTGITRIDATGTGYTTAIAIDRTTTGNLEDTMGDEEEGDIDENAKRGLDQGVTTKCKLMALQKVTAVATVIEDGARNVARIVCALRNEGALPQQMRSR